MTRLLIPDMSCGHCRASVTDALSPLAGVTGLTLNPDTREAEVEGTAAPETLLAALSKIGFPAKITAQAKP